MKYRIYPSLLDKYQNYLSSSEIYQKYWGFSENPEKTEEEFEAEQLQSLFDTINRVEREISISALQGSAFNYLIDYFVNGEEENIIVTRSSNNCDGFDVLFEGQTFFFPEDLTMEFVNYFKGAITQSYTHGILPTIYGDVLLYGYIDEVMPLSLHDIKTTKNYSAGDFKNHWQHLVYLYCENQRGNEVKDFEYNIATINRTNYGVNWETFTEYYNYNPEIDIPKLTQFVEEFIEFLENNKDKITDKKIFNYENSI